MDEVIEDILFTNTLITQGLMKWISKPYEISAEKLRRFHNAILDLKQTVDNLGTEGELSQVVLNSPKTQQILSKENAKLHREFFHILSVNFYF